MASDLGNNDPYGGQPAYFIPPYTNPGPGQQPNAPVPMAPQQPNQQYAQTQAALNALAGMTKEQLDEAIREFNVTHDLNVGTALGTIDGRPTVAQQTATANIEAQRAGLTGMIGGVPTLQGQKQQADTALAALTLLNNARVDPFRYEALARGVSQTGLPNSIAAVTGGRALPTFQAPGAGPSAMNQLASLAEAGGVSMQGGDAWQGDGGSGWAGRLPQRTMQAQPAAQAQPQAPAPDVHTELLNWWVANRERLGQGGAEYPDRPIAFTDANGQTAYYRPGSGSGFVDQADYAAHAGAGWLNPVAQGPLHTQPWQGPMTITAPAAALSAAPAVMNATQGTAGSGAAGQPQAFEAPWAGSAWMGPAGQAGIDTNLALRSLVAPNKINAPEYFGAGVGPGGRRFIQSAYQQGWGIAPEDLDPMVRATLPRFTAPMAGRVLSPTG